MRKVTNEMIANDFNLWCEYAAKTKEAEDHFHELEFDERLKLLIECYGEDKHEDEEQ